MKDAQEMLDHGWGFDFIPGVILALVLQVAFALLGAVPWHTLSTLGLAILSGFLYAIGKRYGERVLDWLEQRPGFRWLQDKRKPLKITE